MQPIVIVKIIVPLVEHEKHKSKPILNNYASNGIRVYTEYH